MITGAICDEGVSDTSLYFGGSGHINIGTLENIHKPFAFVAWINPEAYDRFVFGRHYYNSYYAISEYENAIYLTVDKTLMFFDTKIIGSNGVSYQGFSSGTIELNEWTHIAVVRHANNTVNFYIKMVLKYIMAHHYFLTCLLIRI